jgi:hypothetical protein
MGPEQTRQRHVDRDERRGQKRHLAAEQAEARIDVAGEDLGEAIDDAGVHGTSLVEHLHGLGLVAPACRQKLIELHARLDPFVRIAWPRRESAFGIVARHRAILSISAASAAISRAAGSPRGTSDTSRPVRAASVLPAA